MKKIAFLGAGTWGYCLAWLLASKGLNVVSWMRDPELAQQLKSTGKHPHLEGGAILPHWHFTTDLKEALMDADIIIESVTSKGIRPVFNEVKKFAPRCPIVVTSKGIEQKSGLILPDVVVEILGPDSRDRVGILSGPGYAQEVIAGLPTSLVSAGYEPKLMLGIAELFNSNTFRVYPNSDVRGVAMGGALKNIVAIACGISDGLHYGTGSKAALMTRGLHEIRKLGMAMGCKTETFYGLAGMGDIFLTCGSSLSRNYQFGYLLAQGRTPDEARAEIGMVVEGAYTAVSALQLSQQHNVPMPITEQVNLILSEGLKPAEAVAGLMKRVVKEEHL